MPEIELSTSVARNQHSIQMTKLLQLWLGLLGKVFGSNFHMRHNNVAGRCPPLHDKTSFHLSNHFVTL